jgi:serine/threonine protein kinase
LNAFDIALKQLDCPSQVLVELFHQSLPIDPESKQHNPPEIHAYFWIRLVQSDNHEDAVRMILKQYHDIARELAYVKDDKGRQAINIGSHLCVVAIKESIYFLGRYEITNVTSPHHKSLTSVIYIAADFLDEGNEVALKFMRNEDQYKRELESRASLKFNSKYVIDIIRDHNSGSDFFRAEIDRWELHDYSYCIVMPVADKNLSSIIASECIVASDWNEIKTIASNLAQAVRYLHQNGLIHGDIKPLNIMRMGNLYKFIDLDASAQIGVDFTCSKYSSAYLPPETIFEENEIAFVKQPYEVLLKRKLSGSFNVNKDLYEPVIAHPSQDIWALGVVLYELCSGTKLFLSVSLMSYDACLLVKSVYRIGCG